MYGMWSYRFVHLAWEISAWTCVACDHIDFNMIMIIIIVYIQNVQYLTYTDIYKRMIDNIAITNAMHVLSGHMNKLDWYVHTCQHMNM